MGRGRVRWIMCGVAVALGIGAGAGIALFHRGHGLGVENLSVAPTLPVATWAAGVRPAPTFTLTDQRGEPFTLSALRGRPVIVAFLDPVCRNFCPLEASVLSDAVRRLAPPLRPAIVSISVDPWADSRANFRADGVHWRLGRHWRWGIGTPTQLARVWRWYRIGVTVSKKRIAGVLVREISHTAAAYLIDSAGGERALFLYPFRTVDVISALRKISGRR
jgi:cytochrome oxidase Cu insertion factor (SCO1/SenC/PrrC family)